MLIQIKEKIPNAAGRPPFTGDGVFVGEAVKDGARIVHFYPTHRDGPIEVDDKKAAEFIKLGYADAVTQLPRQNAERAVAPKLEAQRRA